jgi:hypothetical protein
MINCSEVFQMPSILQKRLRADETHFFRSRTTLATETL